MSIMPFQEPCFKRLFSEIEQAETAVCLRIVNNLRKMTVFRRLFLFFLISPFNRFPLSLWLGFGMVIFLRGIQMGSGGNIS
jgi:hypothetical protein